MKSFILIGYRCTGKSSVAQKLANRLGIPHADSDTEIECQAGKNIADIFAQDGETVFRNLEESVIEKILAPSAPLVLATGGGAVLRSSTRKRLRQSGKVFWLTATPETILHRLTSDAASKTMRPNLTSLPMKEEIVAVLNQRIPLYTETAHETIETDSLTPDKIVEMILRLIENNGEVKPV